MTDLTLILGLNDTAVKASLAKIEADHKKLARRLSEEWQKNQDEIAKSNEELASAISKGALVAAVAIGVAIKKSFEIVGQAAADAIRFGSRTGLAQEQLTLLAKRASENEIAFVRLRAATALYAGEITSRLVPALEKAARVMRGDTGSGRGAIDRIIDQFRWTPGRGFVGNQQADARDAAAELATTTEDRHAREAAAELERETGPGAPWSGAQQAAAEAAADAQRAAIKAAAEAAEAIRQAKLLGIMKEEDDRRAATEKVWVDEIAARNDIAEKAKAKAKEVEDERVRLNQDSLNEISDAWKAKLEKEASEAEAQFTAIGIAASELIGGAFAALGNQFANVFKGEDFDPAALFGSILETIGGIVVALGNAAIAAGILGTAVPILGIVTGGPAAIAAGAAAVVAGTLIAAGGSALGSGSSMPSASSAGPSRAPSPTRAPDTRLPEFSLGSGAAEALMISINFNGPVGGSPRRIGRELADILRENSTLRGRNA